MSTEYAAARRLWKKTDIALLKALAKINRKRPVDDQLSFVQFMDDIAAGRISLTKKLPVRSLEGV